MKTEDQFTRTKKMCNRKNSFFDDVDKAKGFWKELGKQKGTRNPSSRWLTEIKSAIHRRVRPSTETESL